MGRITVRDADLADPRDCDAVLALVAAYARDPMGLGRDLPAETRDGLIAGLREHPAAAVALAHDGDHPVGIAVCFLGFSTFAARPLLNIHDLAVLPAARGRGVGRRLLEHVEARARALGCCKITLEVLEHNAVALRLYRAFGFGDGGGRTWFLRNRCRPARRLEGRGVALTLPAGWSEALPAAVRRAHLRPLERFLAGERRRHTVYPPAAEVFEALRLTPYHRVRVVVLGQDPYPGSGQAHGLAFSVRPGVAWPPSLRNILAELRADLGCPAPASGSLVAWARQGVLLLNAVLTVRAGRPGAHRGQGWESLTEALVRAVAARPRPAVFVAWGREARRVIRRVDLRGHPVVEGAHPSPLSAPRGFFGSRPFSAINTLLRAAGEREVAWCLAAPAAGAAGRAARRP